MPPQRRAQPWRRCWAAHVNAYERLDAEALRKVWPTAPPTLTRDLANTRNYRLRLSDVNIAIHGATARVTCVRHITLQPAVGRSQTQVLRQ